MESTFKILFIDDDYLFFHAIKHKINSPFIALYARNQNRAKDILLNETISFAVIDLNLTPENNQDGLEILKICNNLNIPSVLLTSEDSHNIINRAYSLGCLAYFLKDNILDNFENMILSIIKDTAYSQNNCISTTFLSDYPTNCKILRDQIINNITPSFSTNDHLLLTGPTGVGKSKLAKIISKKAYGNSKFITTNLSEYPEEMIESILFGHKKGSFTGAIDNHIGLLEVADQGTLFLDEIGTISLKIQQKLLRILDEKTFYPVGSNKLVHSDFKLITATCDDIPKMIAKNKFREDFYYRINKRNIHIPPLHKRPEDIKLLIDIFLVNSASTKRIVFSKDALNIIKTYSWPGNIRQLKSVVDFLLSQPSGYITPEILQKTNLLPLEQDKNLKQNEKFKLQPDEIEDIDKEIKNQKNKENILSDNMFQNILDVGLSAYLKQIEEAAINREWLQNGKKVNQTVSRLKISKCLFYKFKKKDASNDRISNIQ